MNTTRTFRALALTVLLLFVAVPALRGQQQAPTPAQAEQLKLIEQINGLLKQLTASIVPPVQTVPMVTTAEQLTAAVAKCGDILVGPGTFTLNITVTPNCPTRITGSGWDQTIIVPKDKFSPTLYGGAVRDVLVQDMAIQDAGTFRDTVLFGDIAQTDVERQPKKVVLQRLKITAANGGHRGVGFHGTDLTLQNSEVTGFWEKGRDSQAVHIVNGPCSPCNILNNLLEASGENILTGGADPGIVGMVPRGVVVRGNRIVKTAAMRAGTVKNLVEFKNVDGALVEENLLDGNWADGQSGHSFVLSVRNQDGKCPQCIVNDVTIRRNELRNAKDGFAVNILGYDDSKDAAGVPVASQQTRNITIDGNLFRDSSGGVMVINGVSEGLSVTNNTFYGVTGRFLQWDKSGSRPKVMTPLTFSRNVTKAGAYAIMGDGSTGPGLASLLAYATVKEWNGNFIERHPDRGITYPVGVGNVIVPAGGLAALVDPVTLKLSTGVAGY